MRRALFLCTHSAIPLQNFTRHNESSAGLIIAYFMGKQEEVN
jgi:hypothetical protein